MLDWQTSAAIASALAAILAAAIAVYTVKRTLWLSAMVALEERFAQINHAKIAEPSAWESIIDAGTLGDRAKHLVFETFQFYHQAFLLRQRHAISAADYKYWGNRLETDLATFPAYRDWWEQDQPVFHSAWDKRFVEHVQETIRKVKADARSKGSS